MKIRLGFHYDIDIVSSIEDLNEFLFSLVVLRQIQSESGLSNFSFPDQFITPIYLFIELSSNLNNIYDKLVLIHFPSIIIKYSMSTININSLLPLGLNRVCRYLKSLFNLTSYTPEIKLGEQEKYETISETEEMEIKKLIDTYIAPHIKEFNFRTLRAFITMMDNQIQQLDQCPHINLEAIKFTLSHAQAQKFQQQLQIRDLHKEVLQCLYTLTLRLCNQGNTEDSIKYLLSQPLLCFYEDSELIIGVTLVNQLNDILKDHLFATSNPFFLCAALKSLSFESLYLFLCSEDNQCPNSKKYFKVLSDPILQPTAIEKWWQYLLIYLKIKGCRQSVIISTNSSAQVFKNVHLMSHLIVLDCIKIQIESVADSSKIVAVLERYTHHSQSKPTLVQVTDLCLGATSYSLVKDIFLEKHLQGHKIPDSLLFIWIVQNPSPLLEYVSLRSFTLSFKCNTDNDDEYSVNTKVKEQLTKLFPGEESKYQDLRLEQLLTKVHSFKKTQIIDSDQLNSNNMTTLMVDNFFLIFIYFYRSMLSQQDISKIRDKSIFNGAIYQAIKESYGTKYTIKEMKQFEILLSEHPGLMDFQVRGKLKQYHERFLISIQQEVKQKNIAWNKSLIDTIMTVHTFIELKYPQILFSEPGSGLGKSLLIDILTQFYKGRKAVIRYSGLMDLSYQDFIIMVEKATSIQQAKIKNDVVLVLDDFNYQSLESFYQNGGPQIMKKFKSERFQITIVFLTSQNQCLPKRGIPQIRFKQEHNKKDIKAAIINQSFFNVIREEMTAIFDWYMVLKQKKSGVNDEDNKLFGLRDLYLMQEHIIQSSQLTTDTSKLLSDAFISYFGGIGLNYIKCLPQIISSQIIGEAHFLLQRSLIENRNRHVLLICNDDDYVQALQLIQLVYEDIPFQLIYPYDLFLDSNEDSTYQEKQELHDDLTLRVKLGRLCVIVGMIDAINILYDIIDRPIYNQQQFITRNMMNGALTTRVRPHQNFKCIFVITRSQLSKINSSVISRFQKIIIRNEPKVIDRSERQIFSQVEEWIDSMEVDSSLFARDIRDKIFILQIVKDAMKHSKVDIFAQCKLRIIQLATFKGMIQIQNQLYDKKINDNWVKQYIESNDHFNINETLIKSLQHNYPCHRLQIYTYSSLSEVKMVIADELKVTYIDLISYTLSPQNLRHQIENYFEDTEKSEVLIIYANHKSNQLDLSRWLVDRIEQSTKVVAIILQMNIEVYSNCDYAIGWKNLTIELADGKGTSELSIKEIVASHPIDLFQSSLKKLQVFQSKSLQQNHTETTQKRYHSTNLNNLMQSVINQEWIDKLLKVKISTDCTLQLDATTWPLGSLSSYHIKDKRQYLDIMIQEVLTSKIQEAICSINNFLEDEGLLLLHRTDQNKFDQMLLLSESLFSDVCLYGSSENHNYAPGTFTYFRAVQIRFFNLRKLQQANTLMKQDIDQEISILQGKYLQLYPRDTDTILEIDNNVFLRQFIADLVQKEPEEQRKRYQQFIEAAFSHIMKGQFDSKLQFYAIYWEYEDILAKSWVLINQTAAFELTRYLKFLELHINENISTIKYTPVQTFIECVINSLCDIFLPSYEFFNEYDIWLDYIKDALPLLSNFASDYQTDNIKFFQIEGLEFIQGFYRNSFALSTLDKIHKNSLSVEFACQFKAIFTEKPGDVIALVYQTIAMLIPTDARAMESQVMETIGCYLAQCRATGCHELFYYLSYLQDERNKLSNHLLHNTLDIIALMVKETDQKFYQSVINSDIDQMYSILYKNKLYSIINDFLIGEPVVPVIKPLDFKELDRAKPFTLSDSFVHSLIDVFETNFRDKSLFPDDLNMHQSSKITIVKRKECTVHHLLSIAYFRYRALLKYNIQNEESLIHLERNEQYESMEVQTLFSKIIDFHVIEKRKMVQQLPREVVVSWPVIKVEKEKKKKKGQKQKVLKGNQKKKTSSDEECM